MAINFPSNIDSLTNPVAGDTLDSPSHADQHSNENDAIEALETKVGVDSSAVTTSHDYKLSGVTGSDKAVSKTGTETLTNKTLTLPTFTNGTISFNAPEGFLINGKIVPSVASNNLTVALKGLDGNDPSATNPVYIKSGDTIRTITEALAMTRNAGTNWMNAGSAELATKEIDYFVYYFFRASTQTHGLAISRIPYATLPTDFSDTSTNEKYFSTTPADTDPVTNIGRFAATLSAGAGYTWSVPTFTSANLIQRPIYETRWLDYTATPSYFGGSIDPTSNTLSFSRYKLAGSTASVAVESQLVRGSGNRTLTFFKLPVNFGITALEYSYRLPSSTSISGSTVIGNIYINSGQPTIVYALATMSSDGYYGFNGSYEY